MEYVSFEVEGMSIDSSAPTNNMGYNPDSEDWESAVKARLLFEEMVVNGTI